MLLTNRDFFIALHSIKSYRKLLPVLKFYDWKLVLYLNCIKDSYKDKIYKLSLKYDYIDIINNIKYVNPDELTPGKIVYSKEGWPKHIEGKFEPCGVVWTREFQNFTSDYWVTVDADFEILSPNFIIDAFEKLENDENLILFASDYNENVLFAENYYLMKRYHTWFCIYKKIAQKCKTSLFAFSEITDGTTYMYDECSKFQWDLREQFGYNMMASEKKASFIHYGAFSKNVTLDTQKKVNLYRIITLLAYFGLQYSTISIINRFIRKINKYIRKFFQVIHNKKYKKQLIERESWGKNSKLDE